MKQSPVRAMLIVIMMSALAACGLFKPGPSQVVKDFYHDVEAGKIEDAKKLFSSQVLQTFGAKMVAGLSNQTSEMKKKGGIKSIDTQETVTGDLAKVTYTVTYGDNSVEKGVLDLIKENGEWKIQLSANK
ncbi:MAG TPA: DUF4878 domain-containing protein [Chlorobaculum sp.]|nr:DUF4878 domain-containing protein [Chlorobaculum sp.]